MAVPTACETRWTNILSSFERHCDAIIAGHPDAKQEIELVYTAIIAIVQLIRTSPSVNGNGIVWMKLVDKEVLCKNYEGKALYACLQHLYAEVHREMNETLLLEHGKSNEEFREQKRRKRNALDSEAKNIKKAAKQTTGERDTQELPTRNFFAPLRSAGMELDPTEDTNSQTDGEQQQQPPNSQRGRPPPIILTSTINLIQLQKQLEELVKDSFEF
jgi:hypothetical protein